MPKEMKYNFKTEAIYWIFCLVPFLYLGITYAALPPMVPTHFGSNGTPNGWSSKTSLWFIPASMSLIFYVLFLILPKIDPKQKLRQQSGKFERLRFIIILFISALSCFCIYLSSKQNIAHIEKFLFAGLGLFFAALGNFFPTLKPNYFIGIRSPWALENETVWKKTHVVAGKLWVVAGLLLAVLPFVLSNEKWMSKIFLFTTLAIAIIPLCYSYFIWRKLKPGSAK
jgi:uncharacterized membrane protein